MPKVSTVLLMATVSYVPALAFDPSSLPDTCKESLSGMQGDKARFAELGKDMTRFRKAKDTQSFCKAARDTVAIIKQQNGKLEYCIGDLASSSGTTKEAAAQMMQLGTVYKAMLAAAKDTKNDRFHCGLAEQ